MGEPSELLSAAGLGCAISPQGEVALTATLVRQVTREVFGISGLVARCVV